MSMIGARRSLAVVTLTLLAIIFGDLGGIQTVSGVVAQQAIIARYHFIGSLVPTFGAPLVHMEGILTLVTQSDGTLRDSSLRLTDGSIVSVSGHGGPLPTFMLTINGRASVARSTSNTPDRLSGIFTTSSSSTSPLGSWAATTIAINRVGSEYKFAARIMQGHDKGTTYAGQIELWGDRLGGLLGWLTLSNHHIYSVSGVLANGNATMQIVIRPGVPLFLTGTTLANGNLSGSMVGPLAGDQGQWSAVLLPTKPQGIPTVGASAHVVSPPSPTATPRPTAPATPAVAAQGDITVDFGNRQNRNHPIPPDFMGLGGNGYANVASVAPPYLKSANMALMRLQADLSVIFRNAASATDPTQQNWTHFDDLVNSVLQVTSNVIVTVDYTPLWLQPQSQNPPQTNPCLANAKTQTSTHVEPTHLANGTDDGPTVWGGLAAQVVAHMDHIFPQVHAIYEIWNEPNLPIFLCVPDSDPNPSNTRLTEYKAIYAAAAPQMKAQGQKDARGIQTGGPALSSFPAGIEDTWIPAFVNDATLAPYIDFVSYHHYVANTRTNFSDVLSDTQDPTAGIAGEYQRVASYVRSGRQPDALSTPIYIDEYNIQSDYCCRHDPVYAPVWNSLVVADLLNSVNNTTAAVGPAQEVPHLTYFAAGTPPIPGKRLGNCLFGVWDAQMDCSQSGTIQPYPQYYAYDLLGNSSYLDVTDNGFVATSTHADKPDLTVAGFFTKTKDTVFIVNPSATSYPLLAVLAQNTGPIQTTASEYLLNQAHSTISSLSVNLAHASNGYVVSIPVPAYTTIGLTLAVAGAG